MDNFKKFVELVKDQFMYGGKKYAYSGEREATDVLFDQYGKNWLIGTIDKYTFRFKTCKREKDLLKIATYQYIFWLKRGFWITVKGINDPPLDTTVETKEKEFDKFINNISEQKIDFYRLSSKEYFEKYYPDQEEIYDYLQSDTKLIEEISLILADFGRRDFKEIAEYQLLNIFVIAYVLWERNFSEKAGQDTDTWNEENEPTK